MGVVDPVNSCFSDCLGSEEGFVGLAAFELVEEIDLADGCEVAVDVVGEGGLLVDLGHHEELCLQQIEVVLLMLQLLRNLHDGPLQLRVRPGWAESVPLGRGDDIAVDSHEPRVSLNEAGPIVGDGIIEETDVLQVGMGDMALCELVVVEVEDVHHGEVGEAEGQFGQQVGGQVQLDEGDTLVDGHYLVGSYLCAS